MSVAPIRIPNLRQDQPVVDDSGRMTITFARNLNDILGSIGYTLNQILAIPAIQAALVDLDTATAAAQTAAANANNAAGAAQAQSNLANSYVSGLTLTAKDTGTSTSITVSDHTRMYGDKTTVAVTGGTLTGADYGTTYYIYYDDPSRAGGTVSYKRTIDAAVAAQTGDRHVVGSIATPMAAAPAKTGDPVLPPGAGAIRRAQFQ